MAVPAAVEHKTTMRKFKLLGPAGVYESEEPGTLGGNGKDKIYGRLDCRSALAALKKGDTYRKHRVFFRDEATAIQCGYRPCYNCMRAEYHAWDARQTLKQTEGR